MGLVGAVAVGVGAVAGCIGILFAGLARGIRLVLERVLAGLGRSIVGSLFEIVRGHLGICFDIVGLLLARALVTGGERGGAERQDRECQLLHQQLHLALNVSAVRASATDVPPR